MIALWNRKRLVLTYELSVQAKIREILSANQVDYIINPVMLSLRKNTQAEYKIYVHKKDYERACYLIKDVLR